MPQIDWRNKRENWDQWDSVAVPHCIIRVPLESASFASIDSPRHSTAQPRVDSTRLLRLPFQAREAAVLAAVPVFVVPELQSMETWFDYLVSGAWAVWYCLW